MKLLTISVVVALCAISGCKKKAKTDATAGSGSPVATGSAPAIDAAEAPPDAAATGSGSAAPAGPTSVVQFDALPAGWDRSDEAAGGKLETVIATNETKFPVDNAMFTFMFGAVAGDNVPADPDKVGAWHAAANKTKVTKTEKLGDAHYFAFEQDWLVVKKLGDKLWQCGGSLYKDADYNKIPKLRDEQVAIAKKLCASMKL